MDFVEPEGRVLNHQFILCMKKLGVYFTLIMHTITYHKQSVQFKQNVAVGKGDGVCIPLLGYLHTLSRQTDKN